MNKKMLFVFNPNSGKGLIKNHLMKIVQIFSEGGYDVTVYPTKAPRDGYERILAGAGEYDVVACSGGDGTLNETVDAVVDSEKRLPIGYIPSGTTNDFAVSLGIPRNMDKAALTIVNGTHFSCDIGVVNGKRTFNYVAAFGAFTSVSYNTPQDIKNILGHQAYMLEAIKNLTSLSPVYMRVYADGNDVEGSFIYGMISNTSSVGGIKNLTGKDIDLQDGLFEVTLIRELDNPIAVQTLINAFIMKDIARCEWVCSFKTSKVRFESPVEVAWTLDGEYGGERKEMAFEVLPKAVDFIVGNKRK